MTFKVGTRVQVKSDHAVRCYKELVLGRRGTVTGYTNISSLHKIAWDDGIQSDLDNDSEWGWVEGWFKVIKEPKEPAPLAIKKNPKRIDEIFIPKF